MRFDPGYGYDRGIEGGPEIMNYDFIAIPEEQVPQAADPLFEHLVTIYASETNKTAGMWRAIPDDLLGRTLLGSLGE
jgi:hypothetical protein